MNLYRKISEVMSTNLITVTPNSVLTKVSKIFDVHQIHHIPVVDTKEQIVVGMISKHDFNRTTHLYTKQGWEFAEAANVQLHKTLIAKDIMTHDVIQIDADMTILEGVNLFLKNKFHALIVRSGAQCIGIVTPYDLLFEMKKLTVVLQ